MSINFYWGNYEHPVGEVYPRSIEIRPLFNDENVRWGSAVRFEIAGDFCADPLTPLDSAGVNTRIGQLIQAYAVDYKDFGFKLDGVPIHHNILTNDPLNLSGNRVLSRSWLHRGPNELANTRSYAITLGATFQDNYSQVTRYSETVSQRGDGGERWTYWPNWTGPPTRTTIHEQTAIELIQEGYIEGLTIRPDPPLPYWPDDQVTADTLLERYTPRFHGHLAFDRGTHYGLRYRYRFLRDTVPGDNQLAWPALAAFAGHANPNLHFLGS